MKDIAKFVSIWAVMHTIHALYKTEVFSLLENNPSGLSVKAISDQKKLNFKETAAVLEYISLLLPEVITRQSEDFYVLGEEYRSFYFQSTLHFSLAYLPVISQIEFLMNGKSEYGKEIKRDDIELAKSSEQFIINIVKDLIFLLKNDTFQVLVDLGCGSGYIVNSVVSQMGCHGVGIDNDNVISIQKYSKLNNPLFIEGDISKPELWSNQLPEGKKIFVASMVLHEFLYNSDQELIAFFNNYKKLFSGSILYIIEYSGKSYDELVSLPDDFKHISSVYQFVHPLTKQGLPQNRDKWSEFLTKNSFNNFVVYDTWNNSVIYKVYL